MGSNKVRTEPLLGLVNARLGGFPELSVGTAYTWTGFLYFLPTRKPSLPHLAVCSKGLCERGLRQARERGEVPGCSAYLRNRLDESDPVIGSFHLGQAGTEVIPVVLLVAQEGGLLFLIKLGRERRVRRSKPTAIYPAI